MKELVIQVQESEYAFIAKLLQQFSLPTERIAIELNQEVVRKKEWENIQIKDADKIEIVHFVGGG